jgi:hypothetical protein
MIYLGSSTNLDIFVDLEKRQKCPGCIKATIAQPVEDNPKDIRVRDHGHVEAQ